MSEIKIKDKDTSISIIIYQIILYTAMISGYRGIAYYISLFVIALFVGKIIVRNGRIFHMSGSWNCFMLFLAFYTITSMINFKKDNFYVYFIYYVIVFFPILISEYLKTKSTTEMMKKSLKCFICIFIAFCLISIGYYWLNPGFAREMTANTAGIRMAIGGGYFLAYASAILCVYIFSKMLNKCIRVKSSYVFVCLICSYLVYLTQSSITILAMLIGILISVITKGRETSQSTGYYFLKLIIIGLFSIIVISIVSYNKYEIAEWILDSIQGKDDNILYSRIEEIIDKVVYGKSTFHVDRRSATLTKSLDIFKQYPIFGMGYEYSYEFEMGKLLGIGNHSEILDSLAKYGIVGGFLWLYPYFKTLKMIFKKNLGCVVTILIMMYFNPFVSFHSNAVMFLFIPLFEEIMSRKKQNLIDVATNKAGANEIN